MSDIAPFTPADLADFRRQLGQPPTNSDKRAKWADWTVRRFLVTIDQRDEEIRLLQARVDSLAKQGLEPTARKEA